MSKLKMIFHLIASAIIFVFIVTASFFIDKSQQQQIKITQLNLQLQQAEQQINDFKKQQQRLLTLLDQQQQQASKQKQHINEVLQHENNQNWRDQPVPSDISRLFDTTKTND